MSGKDNGTWWRGTRGIILRGCGSFIGSQIYPDTCFYALEQCDPRGAFSIENIIYYEDGSTRGSDDFDGAFFHCDGNFPGNLRIHGGYIAVRDKSKINGRMATVCMAGHDVRGVLLCTNLPLTVANAKRLCTSDALPDYSITYKETGFCKVADIFDGAETGFAEAVLTADSGASWQLTFTKLAGQPTALKVEAKNPLARETEVVMLPKTDGILSIYVRKNDAESRTYRFITRTMSGEFRPVDYASLRTLQFGDRSHEVREKL